MYTAFSYEKVAAKAQVFALVLSRDLFGRAQKFREMMFPPLGSTGGAVPAGFFAGGNQDVAALARVQ